MRQQLPEVVLGSYVTTPAGQTGRVYQLHHTCPQDDAWMAAQVTFVAGAYRAHPWGSVLCHGGGAVVFPLDLLVPVEPFALLHRDAAFYFGEVDHERVTIGPVDVDPIRLVCQACNALEGEECRVGCLGEAKAQDETFEQAMARLDVVEAALEAREARLDRLEDGLGRLAVTLNNALPLSALGRG